MSRHEKKSQTGRPQRAPLFTRKDCRFCKDQVVVDFTQTELLKKYVTESGRILARYHTGTCARHQRELTRAIKRARVMLLMP